MADRAYLPQTFVATNCIDLDKIRHKNSSFFIDEVIEKEGNHWGILPTNWILLANVFFKKHSDTLNKISQKIENQILHFILRINLIKL